MPDAISRAQLTTFLPALARADEWTGALNAAMDRFDINTPGGTAFPLPLEAEPQRLGSPGPAALAAAQFWQSRGLNHLADDQNDDNDDSDFIAITKIINGGTAGLKSRQQYWSRARTVLGIPSNVAVA